ncbi:hypothetical protein V8C34DRAFT_318517 [Trichoderma compactum]
MLQPYCSAHQYADSISSPDTALCRIRKWARAAAQASLAPGSAYLHKRLDNNTTIITSFKTSYKCRIFGCGTVSFELGMPLCGDIPFITLVMLPNLSSYFPRLNYLLSYILEAAGFPAAMERKWIAVKGTPTKVA